MSESTIVNLQKKLAVLSIKKPLFFLKQSSIDDTHTYTATSLVRLSTLSLLPPLLSNVGAAAASFCCCCASTACSTATSKLFQSFCLRSRSSPLHPMRTHRKKKKEVKFKEKQQRPPGFIHSSFETFAQRFFLMLWIFKPRFLWLVCRTGTTLQRQKLGLDLGSVGR